MSTSIFQRMNADLKVPSEIVTTLMTVAVLIIMYHNKVKRVSTYLSCM